MQLIFLSLFSRVVGVSKLLALDVTNSTLISIIFWNYLQFPPACGSLPHTRL